MRGVGMGMVGAVVCGWLQGWRWILAFAGMTVGGGNDGVGMGMVQGSGMRLVARVEVDSRFRGNDE